MFYLYILKSRSSGRYYIGCTSDLNKRLSQHNHGGTKSTKPYRPWFLIYSESFENRSEAMKREWFLKHPAGYLEKLKITEQYGVE